jgi:small multidrug resistance pump
MPFGRPQPVLASLTMNPWFLLALAILLELSGTICLKLSHGFSRLVPSIGVVCFYLGSFTLMSFSLKTLEVGIVYAIWSGVGTALIAMVGILAFGESITVLKILGLLMIVGGTFLLRLASSQA